MGWLFMDKPKGISVVDFLKERGSLQWSGERYEHTLLDAVVLRMSTLYGAIERVDKEMGEREVFAVVYLLKFVRGAYNFGYKDMDETCGPCEAECPERILNLLTPTTNEYALDWRKRCWDKINELKARPRIDVGVHFKLYGRWYRVTGTRGRKGYYVQGVVDKTAYRVSVQKMRQATSVLAPGVAIPT